MAQASKQDLIRIRMGIVRNGLRAVTWRSRQRMRPTRYGQLLSVALWAWLAANACGELPLRVLTYNIHHGRGRDERIDLPRIAQIIVASQADLVALQEVDRETARADGVDQLATLAQLTGLHGRFGKAIDFDGGQYGVAILSKWKILESDTHLLPSSPAREQRVALAATVVHPTGFRLRFVSTHLDHTRDDRDRRAQAVELNRLFVGGTAKLPTILAGDLNEVPDGAAIATLMAHWLPASLNSLAGTYPAEKPVRKIDYVLLRKQDAFRVTAARVLAQPVASDHAPLAIELRCIEKAAPSRDLGGYSGPKPWSARRAEIVAGMTSIMGALPGAERRISLDVQVSEDVDCGSYRRQLLTYASEADNRVPAYLLIPKTALATRVRTPAVLCLHPTDNTWGHRVVVGLGGRPNRQYAEELAERGYVTIAPAYPLLANYQPDWRALGYASGTMKAIWDNVRAIDLLESLPYVSSDGVGAIGHSLGGHNAVYTAVFDQRIKIVVSSCGLDRYQDYKGGDIRGWTGDRYMPRLLEFAHCLGHVPFEFEEVIAALAPRRCFISAPLHDDNFRWRSVAALAEPARQIYALYGEAEALQIVHPDCAHDFPTPVREQAYAFIDATLKPSP